MKSLRRPNKKQLRNILERGTEDVVDRVHLQKALSSGRQLRVKLGFDPTGAKIHIGRAIVLRKLKAFQDLGHKVVFIVGNFTAQIGDPSDKLEKRPMLSEEQVNKNIANYKEQVGKIIDIKRAEFRFNGDWLSKLTLKETANLAESFSVGQMLRRRNFSERFKKDEEISVREFLYPLMQGYDSVAVKADVELGGFDQLFNLHAGRVIQRYYGQKEQDIMTCAMLEGTDGRKMSTSWGNVINISDEPNDMFGKIMSIRDELISKYFLLCTDVEEAEIRKIVSNIKSKKLNPRDAKLRLAKEIVFIYHGGKAAQKAEENFMSLFSKKDMTVDIPTLEIKNHEKIAVANLPIITKVTASRSEARRLVEQGGLQINEVTKSGSKELVSLKSGDILKIGKRHFFRIIVKK